ncbi:fructose-bisphosphate aldolase [bacterium]|nr:fructose-bisphosphate aldolase [bacterium]
MTKATQERTKSARTTDDSTNGGASDPLRFFRLCTYATGELARIRQLVRPNGTMLVLPYDQFIEHDARHLSAESDAGNPDYITELAVDGGYNAIVFHYGVSKRFWSKIEGRVPLILKVNGKTSLPSGAQALSVHTSFVEDAVRIGAVAIGYTLYYGSPRQDEDLPQLARVREQCDRFGLPLIVWAYPRGEAIEKKGGTESSYAVESAVRMAVEMGASIVKANFPKKNPALVDNKDVPQYFRDLEAHVGKLGEDEQFAERTRRVVDAGQGVPILFSGGEEQKEEEVVRRMQQGVEAGCIGYIFGRNMWKRQKPAALDLTRKAHEMLDHSPGPRKRGRGERF